MIIYISSHSHQCRSHPLDNKDELHDSKEHKGKDKTVDSIVIVVYKKYDHDEFVESR